MRRIRRLNWGMEDIQGGFALGLLFTLSSCSLPDVSFDKQQKRAEAAGAAFFAKSGDSHNPVTSPSGKSYLATVQLRFGENSQPVTFDIHRNRRDLISANLMETEQSSTWLHLGYSHEEGGIAGLRFSFHF